MEMAPSDVIQFVEALDEKMHSVAGRSLLATYVHGSVALGGFSRTRSDIDILVVVDDEADGHIVRLLGRCVAASQPPARGVELSVVTRSQAANPIPPWLFVLHVTTDPADAKAIVGRDHPGDPDLPMHYAVARAAGITVRGPAPHEVIGHVSRPAMLAHLVDELSWGIENAGGAYAVLNAGRALHFLHHDELVSKVDGAKPALAAGAAPTLVERALRVQHGEVADRPPTPAAQSFVESARRQLQSASSNDHPSS